MTVTPQELRYKKMMLSREKDGRRGMLHGMDSDAAQTEFAKCQQLS